jgi:circadian clock protein KaiC
MWLMLGNMENNGVRARTLSVVKARGMGHSNQTHQLVMSKKGVEIKYDAVPGK